MNRIRLRRRSVAAGVGFALLVAVTLAFVHRHAPSPRGPEPTADTAEAPDPGPRPSQGMETASRALEAPAAFGRADFVVLCNDPNDADPKHLRVCSFDGATFALRWKSTPLPDTYPASVRFAIAASRLVLVDGLATLHVYDLDRGDEQPRSSLADRARWICPPREHPDQLWILLATEKGLLFDPVRRTSTPTPEPPSCVDWYCAQTEVDFDCEELAKRAMPTVDDVEPDYLHVDGAFAVVEGHREHGGASLVLVGFPRGGAPGKTWRRAIAPGGPLAGQSEPNRTRLANGRVVAQYWDLEQVHHVVGVDAASGATLWDVADDGDMTLGASRVYLSGHRRVSVRDARTGALLGFVGEPP